MKIPRWFWTGLIGGFLGLAIWVAIGYLTEHEVGYIAWGVGFIVGAAVRMGVDTSNEPDGRLLGVFAAATAIGSILLAKYILFTMITSGFDSAEFGAQFVDHASDEGRIVSIADEVVEEMTQKGQTLKWAPGMNVETAEKEADYPIEVWKEAKARWDAVSPEEKQRTKDEEVAAFKKIFAQFRPSFKDYFSPYDLLWFGLATMTAFRIGNGNHGDES